MCQNISPGQLMIRPSHRWSVMITQCRLRGPALNHKHLTTNKADYNCDFVVIHRSFLQMFGTSTVRPSPAPREQIMFARDGTMRRLPSH